MFPFSGSSPLDISFRLVGISIRIKFSFWIIWGIIGYLALRNNFNPLHLLAWVVVSFGSSFLHELAHVLVGLIFGVRGGIVLGAFGGQLTGNYETLRRWQRIFVYAAGPLANLAIWWGIHTYRQLGNPIVWGQNVFMFAWFVINVGEYLNLFWCFINILPLYPLDGGMIFRDIAELVSRRFGFIFVLVVSMLIAGGFAMYGWTVLDRAQLLTYLPLIFGASLLLQNLFLLIKVLREPKPGADVPPSEPTQEEDYVHEWDKRDRKNEQQTRPY